MRDKSACYPTYGDTVYLDGDIKKAIYWNGIVNVDSEEEKFDCLLHNKFEGYGLSQNEGQKNTRSGMKASMLIDPEMYVRLKICKMVLIEKSLQERIIHY